MALASTVNISNGAGVATLATGSPFLVDPGAVVTVALSSTTSVTQWNCRVDTTELPALGGLTVTQNATFSFTFTAPTSNGTVVFTSETTDGQNVSITRFTVQVAQLQQTPVHSVRCVVTVNVATPTAASAFTVAGNDGVTLVQGDRVLLTAQTGAGNKKLNGVYVVGVVGSGTAALSRPADFATGAVLPGGVIIEVQEGTIFAQTSWKCDLAGAYTVDTSVGDFWPRNVVVATTLVTGFTTVTTVPIRSLSKSMFSYVPTSFNGGATTCSYRTGVIASGGAATAIGIIGTGSVSITACAIGGTFVTGDVSTGLLQISNW